MRALHFKITGHVQGVGFRYTMSKEARRLLLAGWVRNCSDGSVEAVAAGEEAALQSLVGWAQRGPSGAQVDNVQVSTATQAQASDVDDPFNQR
ncbi:MAG TPA: acylphosphatase [Burkholderiaceae bacterium]|nr:acylphosphatase [Burkholderiaceae bacterium]